MRPPEIESSTEEERRNYIKETFPCIADCDMWGYAPSSGAKIRSWLTRITSAASEAIWMCREIIGREEGIREGSFFRGLSH